MKMLFVVFGYRSLKSKMDKSMRALLVRSQHIIILPIFVLIRFAALQNVQFNSVSVNLVK